MSLSQCLFWWITPLMNVGFGRPLQEADLPELCVGDQSSNGLARLEKHWGDEVARSSPSLARAIARMFASEMMGAVPYIICGSAVKIGQTQIFAQLIQWYEDENPSLSRGFYLSSILVIMQLILGLSHHAYVIRGMQIGMRMRAATTSLLFKTALSLTASSLQKTTQGHIVNLASTDIERFEMMAITFVYGIIMSPIEALVCLVLLWREVGISSFAGFGVAVLCVPLQRFVGKKFGHYRRMSAKCSDERVKLTGQLLQGAQQLKMAAWEEPFRDFITSLREAEVAHIFHASQLRGVNQAIFFLMSCVMAFLTFSTYFWLGHVLTR